MATIRKKNFANPDIERDVGRGTLQIVELGDVAIGRIEYQPGWSWIEDLKDRVGTETCQIRHMGVALSGRLGIEMDDGSTFVIEPMDAFDIPAGHLAHVVGDEPWTSIDTVGRRNFGARAEPGLDRYLATILFIDIVGSTELVRRLGDHAWRDLLADHNAAARYVLERYRGAEVGTIGDGLLATFDSPARAVRAAADIRERARELASRFEPGCTPARWSAPPRTSGASRFTTPRASPARPTPVTSSSRARPGRSSGARTSRWRRSAAERSRASTSRTTCTGSSRRAAEPDG